MLDYLVAEFPILLYLIPILLMALGLFMTFKTELAWKAEHFLTVKDGEPSDLYIVITKIGGILFTLVGLFTLIVFIFNK